MILEELTGDRLIEMRKSLLKIAVDAKLWEKYFINPTTKERWIEDYPQSELQGGGPPRLRKVERFPDEIEEELKADAELGN
ncbi:hypothetical protein EB093_09115 [bacterium]|nr:hypothetical protein [bacterium]